MSWVYSEQNFEGFVKSFSEGLSVWGHRNRLFWLFVLVNCNPVHFLRYFLPLSCQSQRDWKSNFQLKCFWALQLGSLSEFSPLVSTPCLVPGSVNRIDINPMIPRCYIAQVDFKKWRVHRRESPNCTNILKAVFSDCGIRGNQRQEKDSMGPCLLESGEGFPRAPKWELSPLSPCFLWMEHWAGYSDTRAEIWLWDNTFMLH